MGLADVSVGGYCGVLLRPGFCKGELERYGVGLTDREREELGRAQLESVRADLAFRLRVAEALSKGCDVETVSRGVEQLGSYAAGALSYAVECGGGCGNEVVGDVGAGGPFVGVHSQTGVGSQAESCVTGVSDGFARKVYVRHNGTVGSEGFDGPVRGESCRLFAVRNGGGKGGESGPGHGSTNGSSEPPVSQVCNAGSGSLGAGRWAASNRRKKEKRRERREVPVWRRGAAPLSPASPGFCETVVSGNGSGCESKCPSYGQALSDAEREARDTLAQRRAAENKVAKKLAEMKLASLEDEKKCQEYADLKHQRIVQWTNEATAKSQRSLEKCKSIDPSSSASQYEIRQQAKDLADTKLENKLLSKVIMENCDNWHELLRSCEPVQDSIDTEAMDLMNDNYLREVKNEENFMVFDDSVTRHLARRS